MIVRVLIVAASMDILGGQAVQAERLVRHLRKEPSLEVAFLPINPRLPGLLRRLQSIKYIRTLTTSLLYWLNLLREVKNYDVIHIFSASYFSFVIAPTPAILAAKLYGKKIILNYHSGEAADHLKRWPRSTLPILKRVDAVVVPSEYLVRVFRDFGIEASAIFNIVELDKFVYRERPEVRPLFLSNRNLEPHYGVDCVLRAFAIIQRQFPEAALTIAGDGSQRSALEDLKRQLNLQQTSFLGRVQHDEIYRLYSSSDIFLNASKIDNQPLSVLEAFACGLPVVTTDAGGIPDMVKDGDTGCVVAVGDCEALAQRAIKLLKDHQFAMHIAQRALVECDRYTWRVVCHQWLNLYHNLGTNLLDIASSK